MKKIIIAISVAVVLLLSLSIFVFDMKVDNREMEVRENFHAQIKNDKIQHDQMRKIIKKQASVTEKQAEVFTNQLRMLADGRKDNGGLFRMISEQNPNFDQTSFNKLMESVAVQTAYFSKSQKRSNDMANEWKKMVQRAPKSWFIDNDIKDVVKGKSMLDKNSEYYKSIYAILKYEPVTSTATKDAFETGVDDDESVF